MYTLAVGPTRQLRTPVSPPIVQNAQLRPQSPSQSSKACSYALNSSQSCERSLTSQIFILTRARRAATPLILLNHPNRILCDLHSRCFYTHTRIIYMYIEFFYQNQHEFDTENCFLIVTACFFILISIYFRESLLLDRLCMWI